MIQLVQLIELIDTSNDVINKKLDILYKFL